MGSEAVIASFAEFPDVNPAPVCRLAADGTVELANMAALRLFGGDAIVGRPWTDICPQMSDVLWEDVRRAETPMQHEADFGGLCILFTYIVPAGRAEVFAFGSDVTALRQAERRLAAKTAQLAEVARFPEMNPGPVLRMDDEGIILLANEAAKKIFGSSVVGCRWLEICPAVTAKAWDSVRSSPDPVAIESTIGECVYVFTHRADSASRLVFVFGTDITQQKLAEKALRQSEKMATLGTLAAGVAHELNNPAAATRRASHQLREAMAKLVLAHLRLTEVSFTSEGHATMEEMEERARFHAARPFELDPVTRSDHETLAEDWLEERNVLDATDLAHALVAQGLDVEKLSSIERVVGREAMPRIASWGARSYHVYSLLHEINQGATRISDIVDAMKGYTYIGQAPIRLIDLHEGIDNTLVILSNKIKAGITVRREYDRTVPQITAHGGELNQVWTNLIDNAADALNGKGTITIRTSRNGRSLVVEVEDDGPGIPQEIQSRIFDPFFTTKEPGKGTGLGLWMTYSIITEQHNGELTCQSRPGRTLFTVRLPMDASVVDRGKDVTRGSRIEDGTREG